MGGAGAGTPEIWTITGNTATAYAITGIPAGTPAAAAEGSGSALTYPADSWALNDGGINTATTTATDSVKGTADPIINSGSYSWANDDSFSDVLDTSQGRHQPRRRLRAQRRTPPPPSPSGSTPPPATRSWSPSTTARSPPARRRAAPPPPDTTPSCTSEPTESCASNGGWAGPAKPYAPPNPSTTDSGATPKLAASTSSQTLTLDSTSQTLTGTVNISAKYFYIGAGFIGGGWPDETYNGSSHGMLEYFNGDIADVTFTK
jgi:hypothetical protein